MDDHSFRRFTGAMLTAAGVLLAGLSGLCSLSGIGVVLASILSPSSHASGAQLASALASLGQFLFLVLIFGGLPFAVGLLMIRGGLRMMKGKPPPDRPFSL